MYFPLTTNELGLIFQIIVILLSAVNTNISEQEFNVTLLSVPCSNMNPLGQIFLCNMTGAVVWK
jgi:hypothetical protein